MHVKIKHRCGQVLYVKQAEQYFYYLNCSKGTSCACRDLETERLYPELYEELIRQVSAFGNQSFAGRKEVIYTWCQEILYIQADGGEFPGMMCE